MTDFRYKLASNKLPKLDCPSCGKAKHWQLYYNILTGEALPEIYGLCDNISKCGHGVSPYKDGYVQELLKKQQGQSSGTWQPPKLIARPEPRQKPEPVFIPNEVLKQTLRGYDQNVFIQNLLHNVKYPFAKADIEAVIAHYYLGTVCNGYRKGAITFPFIDRGGNVRAIQVKQFNESNHTISTDFLHSIIDRHHTTRGEHVPEWLKHYNTNEIKVSCLLGSHLLDQYKHNPIILVEAPKSAVVCSLYYGLPTNYTDPIFLAVYNLSSLTLDKCRVLAGRSVYLFPDLSADGKAFDLWSSKADQFNREIPKARFTVSTLLEDNATEADRQKGLDVADYLIRLDWRAFRPNYKPPPEQPETAICEKREKCEGSNKPFISQPEKSPIVEAHKTVQIGHYKKEPAFIRPIIVKPAFDMTKYIFPDVYDMKMPYEEELGTCPF